MGGEWQVEDGNSLDAKVGAVDGGVASNFHYDPVREELPLRAREFASGHGAVGDDEVVWPSLLHHLAGEEKWVGGGEHGAVRLTLQANASDYVLKLAALAVEVVGAPRSLNVLVVGASREHQVAFRLDITRIEVISYLIGAKGVNTVVNFDV